MFEYSYRRGMQGKKYSSYTVRVCLGGLSTPNLATFLFGASYALPPSHASPPARGQVSAFWGALAVGRLIAVPVRGGF